MNIQLVVAIHEILHINRLRISSADHFDVADVLLGSLLIAEFRLS